MAPKLSNEDETDHANIGHFTKDVTNFSSNNEPATDLCQHENHRDERGTVKNIPMIQKVQYPPQIQAKPSNGQQHFDVSSKKRQRRKKLSLPIHNPGKETSFRKRLRRKHQLSLENFFADVDQELRFRFGLSHQDFVLPLGVEPSPSAKQRSSQARKRP